MCRMNASRVSVMFQKCLYDICDSVNIKMKKFNPKLLP